MVLEPVVFSSDINGLISELIGHGIEAVSVTREVDLDAIREGEVPMMAIIDVRAMSIPEFKKCVNWCSRLSLPAIALLPDRLLDDIESLVGVDDFVVEPLKPNELLMRARRLVDRKISTKEGDFLSVGHLVINRTNYEVSVGGRRVNLRFKEYELLLLLASSPGRVYTREGLLNHVWGYDYLGGTRTVDVHIRRLRSKIEDGRHTFIETVWNVGYRFKDMKGQL